MCKNSKHRRRNGRKPVLYAILAAAALWMTACERHTVYYHYEHTPVAGWERNDTLSFSTAPLSADGNYNQGIGVRISGTYPFMSLNLIVEQTIMPSKQMHCDTLCCTLIDEKGNAKGYGISQYQYLFPLRHLQLHKGDRLLVSIRHDMKREILPGITDIGIQLTRKD